MEYVEFEDVKPKKLKTELYNFHDYQQPIKKEIKQEFDFQLPIKKEPKQEVDYQLPIKKEPKHEFKIEKNNLKLEPQDVKTEHGKPDRRFDINPLKFEEPQKEKKKKKHKESKREKVEPKSIGPTTSSQNQKRKESKKKEPEKKDPLNWNYVKCPQCWVWVKQRNMKNHIRRHMYGSPESGSRLARPKRINIEEKRAQSELAAARAREALELSRSENTCPSSVPAALEEVEDFLEDDSAVGNMFSWSPPPISSPTQSPPCSPSAHTSPLSPPVSPSPSWSPLSPQLSPS